MSASSRTSRADPLADSLGGKMDLLPSRSSSKLEVLALPGGLERSPQAKKGRKASHSRRADR
jgi:hypothetical protein